MLKSIVRTTKHSFSCVVGIALTLASHRFSDVENLTDVVGRNLILVIELREFMRINYISLNRHSTRDVVESLLEKSNYTNFCEKHICLNRYSTTYVVESLLEKSNYTDFH
jgi:hypothetical protein